VGGERVEGDEPVQSEVVGVAPGQESAVAEPEPGREPFHAGGLGAVEPVGDAQGSAVRPAGPGLPLRFVRRAVFACSCH
jgi:hypothetical protein